MSARDGMAITMAYLFDYDDEAADMIGCATETDLAAALAFCAHQLADAWRQQAAELGMTLDDYAAHCGQRYERASRRNQ